MTDTSPAPPLAAFAALTPTERKVSRLVSLGYDYDRIGKLLGIDGSTVGWHVSHIAAKLPNPDELKPQTLVLLWAAHHRWLEDRAKTA